MFVKGIGGVYNAFLVSGQVGNVITNRNANRLEFERLLDGAKTYMRHHKVKDTTKKPLEPVSNYPAIAKHFFKI